MRELVNETITLSQDIAAEPVRVFKALTEEIGAWWTHRFVEGSQVAMEPRIGGRFYEEWAGRCAALYATVQFIEPPRKLRLLGPMGMDGAVASSMEFSLEPTAAGTRLRLAHDMLGWTEPEVIVSYRDGWEALLGESLKKFCEEKKG